MRFNQRSVTQLESLRFDMIPNQAVRRWNYRENRQFLALNLHHGRKHRAARGMFAQTGLIPCLHTMSKRDAICIGR